MKKQVATGLFINDQKEILLCLRDDKPDIDYPNTWGFIGGHINPGETELDALKREVMEEIGFNVKNPLFIKTIDDGAGNEVFVYKIKINLDAKDLTLTEGQKLEYFSLEKIKKLKNIPPCIIDLLCECKKEIFE